MIWMHSERAQHPSMPDRCTMLNAAMESRELSHISRMVGVGHGELPDTRVQGGTRTPIIPSFR